MYETAVNQLNFSAEKRKHIQNDEDLSSISAYSKREIQKQTQKIGGVEHQYSMEVNNTEIKKVQKSFYFELVHLHSYLNCKNGTSQEDEEKKAQLPYQISTYGQQTDVCGMPGKLAQERNFSEVFCIMLDAMESLLLDVCTL